MRAVSNRRPTLRENTPVRLRGLVEFSYEPLPARDSSGGWPITLTVAWRRQHGRKTGRGGLKCECPDSGVGRGVRHLLFRNRSRVRNPSEKKPGSGAERSPGLTCVGMPGTTTSPEQTVRTCVQTLACVHVSKILSANRRHGKARQPLETPPRSAPSGAAWYRGGCPGGPVSAPADR